MTQPHLRNRSALERRPIFWFYGSAALAFGIKNNAFGFLLLIYANQVLGVPGYLASLALGVAMLWDAVTDLLLGHWSDKTSSRLGRRHPFMYASLLVLPLAFYALFNPPADLDPSGGFWYVLLMAVLVRTGTTLFEMPSIALLPELESTYDGRNKWLALRYAFGWYGGNGIHTINFMWWVGAYGVSVQAGYSIYGAVGAWLIAAVIILSALGTQREAAGFPRPSEGFRPGAIGREVRQIFESLKNGNFGALFFYGLAVGVANGLGAALYIYNTTYFFEFTGPQIAFTGLCVMLSPLAAYALAPWLGSRYGKVGGATAGVLLNMAIYPLPYLLVLAGFWPELGSWSSLYLYAFVTVSEVTFNIVGAVLLDSMMADVVEDSEVSTRRRSEGLFYAARGFAGKAVSAGGIVGAGTIVSMVGLDSIGSVSEMTDAVRQDIALMFLPAYCGLHIAALACLAKYRISREGHDANLNQLGRPPSP